jgi:hypothetical protein
MRTHRTMHTHRAMRTRAACGLVALSLRRHAHKYASACAPLPPSPPRADRGFLRRLFIEETPAAAAFTGLAWLVLGVPTTEGLLYDDDWQEMAARKPDNFRLTYAISREQSTADGRKMYVQDRLNEHAEELFNRYGRLLAHVLTCWLAGLRAYLRACLLAGWLAYWLTCVLAGLLAYWLT